MGSGIEIITITDKERLAYALLALFRVKEDEEYLVHRQYVTDKIFEMVKMENPEAALHEEALEAFLDFLRALAKAQAAHL